jgi:hypothetical protein
MQPEGYQCCGVPFRIQFQPACGDKRFGTLYPAKGDNHISLIGASTIDCVVRQRSRLTSSGSISGTFSKSMGAWEPKTSVRVIREFFAVISNQRNGCPFVADVAVSLPEVCWAGSYLDDTIECTTRRRSTPRKVELFTARDATLMCIAANAPKCPSVVQ